MPDTRDIFISNAEIGFEVGPTGTPFHPAVYACTARVLDESFQRIVRDLLPKPLNLPQVAVSLVSSRLIDGGAEIVVRARRGMLDQNVTTRVELSPGSGGSLRVTVTYMRIGVFAASWLLEFVLGAVNRQAGLRQSGPRSIDIDIATMLRAREVPVSLRAGVTGVAATASELTVIMG